MSANTEGSTTEVAAAQRENRTRFVGGFYGQLVSGILWLTSAGLATWSAPRAAIRTIALGGFLIVSLTELFVRLDGAKLGAHYLPFVFLYGMRMSGVLAAALVGGGMLFARYWPASFSGGASYGAVVLLIFAVLGKAIAGRARWRGAPRADVPYSCRHAPSTPGA